MNYQYDTHLHSNHSDGDFSPKEVAKQAKKAGLKGAVLTDHNTIEGYDEFLSARAGLKLQTVVGVEISTRFKGAEVHILGYAKEFKRNILRSGLKPNIQGYNTRSAKMMRLLQKFGETKMTFAEIRRTKNSFDPMGKYDIAQALRKERGLARCEQKTLQKLCDRGGPAYVPYSKEILSPQQACQLIQKAGGISVIAHPAQFVRRYKLGTEKSRVIMVRLIKELVGIGLKGIEVRSFEHSKKEEEFYKKLAKELNLITLGGSDWHGQYHHPKRIFDLTGSTIEEYNKLTSILAD